MKTFAISIPKPCHEDWNKMTPDAKGAFCASCQKSVYDFSNKTDEEIISVFEKEEKGNVCGRFAPAQLSRPVVSFGNESSTNRLAMFLYALLLAFGATLFSGAEAFAQDVKGDAKVIRMGKMSVRPIETNIEPETIVEKDTVLIDKEVEPRVCTNVTIDGREMPLGQAVMREEPVVIKTMGDTVITPIEDVDTLITVIETIPPIDTVADIPEQLVVMGAVAYIPTIIEPVVEEIVPLTEEKTEDKPVETEEIIKQDNSIIEEEIIDDNSKAAVETIIFPPSDLEVKISPNPSRGEITLSYTLETAMPVKIDLYDITGKFVKTLTQLGNQYAGKYNVSYNISDLQNGIYFATLMTNDKKSSTKIILTK